MEAAAHGVATTWSELVGLVPERVLHDAAARHVQLRGFTPDMVLERRVREAMGGGQSLAAFVGEVASSNPTPGGGSVAAHAGALGAALVQMVAGLTAGKKKYVDVDAEMRAIALEVAGIGNQLAGLVARDAAAYEAVARAYKLPPETDAAERARAVQESLELAAEVPLETARLCARVAELAADVAARGNSNAVSDAGVAALLAEAACRGAAYNVRINVTSMSDRALGAPLVDEVRALVARTSEASARATAAVERALA
jgi:formiminotetrahydrofolate cyclodeaminase